MEISNGEILKLGEVFSVFLKGMMFSVDPLMSDEVSNRIIAATLSAFCSELSPHLDYLRRKNG